MGLVAPQPVGSSRNRDRAHVPCIGMWIPNHWTTREVLEPTFNLLVLSANFAPLLSRIILYH